MRIGVNCVHLVPKSGDADVFLRNTLLALRRGHPKIELVLFTDPVNDSSYEGWHRICVGTLGRESFFSHAENTFRRAVQSAQVDRLFTPLATAPAKCSAPIVPFVMDMGILDTSQRATHWWGEVRPRDLRKAALRASAVVVPSEYARRRLLEGLSVPLECILVAIPGSDHVPGTTHPCPVAKPFLLSVCDPEDHDKIPELVQVYQRVRAEIPHNLIIVGEPSEIEPPDWGEGQILSLKKGEKRLVQKDMVFHMVPAAFIYRETGVGFSATLHVTETGCEPLSMYPGKLIVKNVGGAKRAAAKKAGAKATKAKRKPAKQAAKAKRKTRR